MPLEPLLLEGFDEKTHADFRVGSFNLLSRTVSAMENGVDSWDSDDATLTQSNTFARSGQYSLKAVPTINGDVEIELLNVRGIDRNEAFGASVYAYSSVSRAISISIVWYDINESVVSTTTSDAQTTPGTRWIKIEVVGIAPDNARLARIVFTIDNAAMSDAHYFDDVRFYRAGWAPNPMDDPLACSIRLSSAFQLRDAIRDGTSSMAITTFAQSPNYSIVQSSGGISGARVTAGSRYRAMAWFRPGGAARNVAVAVFWYDQNGALLSYSTSGGIEQVSQWQLTKGTFTAPTGAAFAAVGVALDAAGNAETHYVDDVALIGDDDILEASLFTRLMWRYIPDYLKLKDSEQTEIDRPFLRWLALFGLEADAPTNLIDRFWYIPPDDGGDATETSDLVDPLKADSAWLFWLAWLVGVRLDGGARNFASWESLTLGLGDEAPPLTWAEMADADTDLDGVEWGELDLIIEGSADLITVLRNQIATASTGWAAGSARGLRSIVRDVLTDTKEVQIRRQFDGNPWHVLIRTNAAETPSADAVLSAANQTKPAGVKFFHEFI